MSRSARSAISLHWSATRSASPDSPPSGCTCSPCPTANGTPLPPLMPSPQLRPSHQAPDPRTTTPAAARARPGTTPKEEHPMPANYKKLLAAAGAAAVAGAIALAGVTAASAASPAVSGTEHFQFMTTTPTASNASIIATGAFTAGGVDHPGRTTDTLVFPTGSFKVTHS